MPKRRSAALTPGTPLDLAFLRLRRLYWWSLGLALVLHLIVVLILATVFSPNRETIPEPAKVKFFSRRDPLLAKPLELRKVPQPKRQLVKREQQVTAARMDQVQAIAAFDTRGMVAGQGTGANILAPSRSGERPATPPGMGMVLRTSSLSESRAADNKIDLALEMLDVNSMDTGRYRALVIQDVGNRQNVKGFVKMANVVSVHIKNSTGGSMDPRLMGVLCETLNNFTGLKAEYAGDLTYDDQRVLDVPIIFIDARYLSWSRQAMAPNEAEIMNLAQYLLQGGFIIGPLTHEIAEGLEKYGGMVKGRDFWEARVPDDHPVYGSFFDIRGGVPSGSTPHNTSKSEYHQVLVGWFLRGRMIAIQPTLGWGWENFHYPAENTRQLQMAVNVIIFALTQEGSMTQRLMQMVN